MAQIGAELNMPARTVCNQLSRPEMRALVERYQAQLVEHVPAAMGNLAHAIDHYQAPDADAQLREHGYKASQRVLEAASILPSHTPSVLVQQIIAGGDNLAADLSEIREFLSQRLGGAVRGEDTDPVIDIAPDISPPPVDK